MAGAKEKTIVYAVAFRSKPLASELGEMLWSVLGEVEAFYNLDKKRARFESYWLGDTPPPALLSAEPSRVMTNGIDTTWWMGLRSTNSRLVDQELLIKAVQKLVPDEERLIIVTDEEITPPPEWRYIIWDGALRGGGVVSLAPLDPKYWGDPDPDRLQTIKRRIRAALMSMTGQRLGFRRCNNSKCYLYANVDSVTVLDGMITLGHEHSAEGLNDRVFTGATDDFGLEIIEERPKASFEY